MTSGKFGMHSSHWALVTNLLVNPIKEAGARVSVFGSRARGDHKDFSDLDILVEGAVSPELISTVRERLEESELPFRVDIVLEADLAEAYRTSVFRDRVELD